MADNGSAETGPGYASPQDAVQNAPREEILWVSCIHEGTGVNEPDFLATVDVDPNSPTYCQIVHKLPMPNVGDELHHFGWHTCSSAHDCCGLERRYLVIPGLRSSRIHIVDVLDNPRAPKLFKVIEPEEIIAKTGYTAPHTVHCMPGGVITISMLGNANGDAPGGFVMLDAEDFSVKGRWENEQGDQKLNYDFWYQPRCNVMMSSEWGAPNTIFGGFDIADVEAGKYGHRIHVWDFEKHDHIQTIDLGEDGLIPLELRFLHEPTQEHAFVGAALSSKVFHLHKSNGKWEADAVISVEAREKEGWPFPVPGLISDILISMDDRFLYFANWFHGTLNQYDIRDPFQPKLTGQVKLGGMFDPAVEHQGRTLTGGPQMLQLSMDGRRLYVTNTLFSAWDNQFYPDLQGWMVKVDCDLNGGMSIDADFFVDFSPARGHEMRYPGGDVTTEIFV